ncbi:MAG: hypothetical protein L0G94_07225 [Brachybacterium sp.]|uniref:hypothetical protein n=1 Tax=Brachybacterium sp. TaxID=1891286 RepID=UPI0026488E62|nr:hypothetical protein [Brachybacterium sp.]MDN5686462.1 hypothetical protein [Brachybacterium sp.]
MNTWASGELITAERLNETVQAVAEVDAKATATASQVDQIKLANSSMGEGAPSGAAPVGWWYEDVTTGDVYRMEA